MRVEEKKTKKLKYSDITTQIFKKQRKNHLNAIYFSNSDSSCFFRPEKKEKNVRLYDGEKQS